MASETRVRTRWHPSADVWPPDDTEESILGTELHQKTITNLRVGINEVAHLCRTPGQPLPWQALTQIAMLGCLRPDDTEYRTYPDLFIYRQNIDWNRGSVGLVVDGPPVLIIEVLSESTYTSDVHLERGKAYSYARAGVREYLALDPTGAFVPDGGRAWRLADGGYRPWKPDANGRWQSDEIAVAIGLEGAMATVYTHDGRRLLREGEISEAMERRDRALERQNAELERQNAELERQNAELERMRRLLDERTRDQQPEG